jgi:hypothetical protein
MEGSRLGRVGPVTCQRYISDPKSKAKSVMFTEEGERLSRELFERHFARVQGAKAES